MIEWRAEEFEYRAKDASWYWLSIMIAVVLLTIAIWQKNLLFAFFVLVAEVLMLVWGSQVPETLDFSLGKEKLRIGNRKEYSLREITEYSRMDPERDPVSFIFVFRNHFRPAVRIPVPQEKQEEVREHFREASVKEVEHEHTLIDTLEDFLGF